MQITAVNVQLHNCERERGLVAFVNVEFDRDFIVRELKVIRGESGLFVVMPNRRYQYRCESCTTKNHLMARYCNNCGFKLPPRTDAPHLHTDVAHPTNTEFRNKLQEAVLAEYDRVSSSGLAKW